MDKERLEDILMNSPRSLVNALCTYLEDKIPNIELEFEPGFSDSSDQTKVPYNFFITPAGQGNLGLVEVKTSPKPNGLAIEVTYSGKLPYEPGEFRLVSRNTVESMEKAEKVEKVWIRVDNCKWVPLVVEGELYLQDLRQSKPPQIVGGEYDTKGNVIIEETPPEKLAEMRGQEEKPPEPTLLITEVDPNGYKH